MPILEETRWCRADGVLGTENTNSEQHIVAYDSSVPSDARGYYYSDVYIVRGSSNILLGSNVAAANFGNGEEGFHSVTWICPETELQDGDKLKVVHRVVMDDVTVTGTWVSEAFNDHRIRLNSSTWTFTRYHDVDVVGKFEGYAYLYYGSSGKYCKIDGLSFYVIVLPTVENLDGEWLSQSSFKLRGVLVDDGGEPCDVRFKWRKIGSDTWNYTDWQSGYETNDTFEETLTGLEPGHYEYVAQASNRAGTSDASTYYFRLYGRANKAIALLGDSSTHGGTLVTHNQDGTLKVGGTEVAVNGALHQCGIVAHGTTEVSAVTVKSYHNGKLILTYGAVAGCGAVIIPPDRNVYVE